MSRNCLFPGLLMEHTSQLLAREVELFFYVSQVCVCSALSFLFLFVSKAASKVAESLKIIKKCLPLIYLKLTC